ncbi:MAG: hypothetical protein K8R40_00290 [Anaerolineaceae bacterium]|nr:hypothetical protein [Anaerolineaceae bacterium]
MKCKLLLTEPEGFSQEARDILDSFCDVTAENSTYEELLEKINNFEILFIRLGIHFDRALLSKGKRIKYLVTPTTGLDHIDLQAAKDFGIEVLSLKGETVFLKEVLATAELTWGLLLSLVRHIPVAFEDVRDGIWDRDSFKGNELSKKRLGILGLGRLGEIVARYGIAFGMQVVAFDPYREGWIPGIARANSLEQLLANSDVLSVHVPLNSETEGMLGEKELNFLPRGSWIINTSRGKILDENALLRNLSSGHLAGAGLDVLAGEVQGTNWAAHNKLVRYSTNNHNLIITPHLGGATYESMEKTELFMAEKLRKLLDSLTNFQSI